MSTTGEVLGSWESENVTLGQVEAALTDLRRQEPRAAVRTSVLTFVVVIDAQDEADSVVHVVRDLGGRHPSRSIVLVLADDDGDRGLDAHASLNVTERDGRAVCFEDVVLTVKGPGRFHLDSVVQPLTLPDLPVVVWSPFKLPSPGNPLLAAADRVIIDTRFLPQEEDFFARVAALIKRFPVADMSWVRLAPWRSLLATLFEPGSCHDYLHGVHTAEVDGHFGPRHLLAGWLRSRLALPVSALHLEEAEHVSIRVAAAAAERGGRFAVERRGDEHVIYASVQLDDGFEQEQMLQLVERSRAEVLAEALSRMGRDAIYEQAQRGALELLR